MKLVNNDLNQMFKNKMLQSIINKCHIDFVPFIHVIF